jgi:hypothetical protein
VKCGLRIEKNPKIYNPQSKIGNEEDDKMAEKMTVEEIADAMYKIVEASTGKKKLKPNDLPKEVITQYGEDRVSRADAKKALRELIDSGRCIYTYFGGTFIEIPPKEGAANE